jgi:hypothetical protein
VGPSRPRSRRADPTPHQCALSPSKRALRHAQGTYSTGSGHILDRLKAHTRQAQGTYSTALRGTLVCALSAADAKSEYLMRSGVMNPSSPALSR